MKVIRHMSMNIEGLLRWNKNMNGLFEENGKRISHKQAMAYLLECKSKGWKVIPMTGVPCEGWSYETGCPGHEQK
jgi:hypothetical protein